MIVAIDGPGGAGKGTLARRLAQALDFAHLDTGRIYRAVAAKLMALGCDPSDRRVAARVAAEVELGDLDHPGLRDEPVGRVASVVAAQPDVRRAVFDLQRRFVCNPPGGKHGAVVDGRDIGTVVCPEAEVKLFVTASIETRAARRHKELRDRGEASIYARVLEEMQARDIRDSARAASPLRAAADAVVLDTSEMDVETVFEAASDIVASVRRHGPWSGPRRAQRP